MLLLFTIKHHTPTTMSPIPITLQQPKSLLTKRYTSPFQSLDPALMTSSVVTCIIFGIIVTVLLYLLLRSWKRKRDSPFNKTSNRNLAKYDQIQDKSSTIFACPFTNKPIIQKPLKHKENYRETRKYSISSPLEQFPLPPPQSAKVPVRKDQFYFHSNERKVSMPPVYEDESFSGNRQGRGSNWSNSSVIKSPRPALGYQGGSLGYQNGSLGYQAGLPSAPKAKSVRSSGRTYWDNVTLGAAGLPLEKGASAAKPVKQSKKGRKSKDNSYSPDLWD